MASNFFPARRTLGASLIVAVVACSPDVISPSNRSIESSNTASVDGGVTAYANQPAGFISLLNNSASVLPPVTVLTQSLDGLWKMNSSATTKAISTTSSPCTPPGAWSTTYKAGLKAGGGPVTLWGLGGVSPIPEARQWYLRACIKVGKSGAYENNSWGTKLWFITVGDSPSTGHCSIIPVIMGDGQQAVKSTWRAYATFECSGVLPTVGFQQLSTAGRPIKADVWQVHELLIDAGSVNQSNGRFQWWIDGQPVLDRKNQKFRTTNSGFYHGLSRWKWAPTWGGVLGAKTRDDDYQIDDIYVSAYGEP